MLLTVARAETNQQFPSLPCSCRQSSARFHELSQTAYNVAARRAVDKELRLVENGADAKCIGRLRNSIVAAVFARAVRAPVECKETTRLVVLEVELAVPARH